MRIAADRQPRQQILTVLNTGSEKLVAAVTAGGEMPSLIAAIQSREGRRKELTDRLAALDAQRSFRHLDLRPIQRDLERRLSDWQRVFAQATQASALPRQALRKLFAGQPLILMPRTDGTRRYYEFSGRISVGKLLAGITGIIDPTTVASPTGFEPVFRP